MNRREFIMAACGAAAGIAAGLKASDAGADPRKRRVQILRRDKDAVGSWVDTEMRYIKKGNFFRMFEPSGEEVVDPKGHKIWVAKSDAHQACSGAPDESVWGCEAEPPFFPIIMKPGRMIDPWGGRG